MLNSLRIQNFKSWKDTGDIQFGAITGFFGTNSSGKTSILQFLLMLKQTVESSDRAQILNLGDEHSYVELGTMYDIIHNHADPGKLEFDIQWRNRNIFYLEEEDPKEEYWEYNISKFSSMINRNSNTIEVKYLRFEQEDKMIGMNLIGLSENFENRYSIVSTGFINRRKSEVKVLPVRPFKFYGIPSVFGQDVPEPKEYREWLFDFEEIFSRTYYLAPLRDYPKRLYSWSGEKTQDVGNRGERVVAAILASKNNTKNKSGYNLEEHVAYWLKELGLVHSFAVRPIAPNRKEYEVRIKRTEESAEVFLTDVGFGVSQLLPVFVLLFYVPEGSTIILEQPEIHLHPAVQAGLADVFIDAIKRRNVQIILESHSEHLLQRLQLRMAEKGINPDKEFDSDKAKLYFTSIEKGSSKLTPLQLDEYGNINNWPDGFFGDTLGEAAAMMKAEMKRKMQQQ